MNYLAGHKTGDWYFEVQLKRWGIAKVVSDNGRTAVLDGEPLQPLWYNWIFCDHGFRTLHEAVIFFHRAFSYPRRADSRISLAAEAPR